MAPEDRLERGPRSAPTTPRVHAHPPCSCPGLGPSALHPSPTIPSHSRGASQGGMPSPQPGGLSGTAPIPKCLFHTKWPSLVPRPRRSQDGGAGALALGPEATPAPGQHRAYGQRQPRAGPAAALQQRPPLRVPAAAARGRVRPGTPSPRARSRREAPLAPPRISSARTREARRSAGKVTWPGRPSPRGAAGVPSPRRGAPPRSPPPPRPALCSAPRPWGGASRRRRGSPPRPPGPESSRPGRAACGARTHT